uniref:Putative secreted protein n=1 Tax=Anopheles marajoara TaxID=58244 RepID=A0A2M4CGH7_9DIPT
MIITMAIAFVGVTQLFKQSLGLPSRTPEVAKVLRNVAKAEELLKKTISGKCDVEGVSLACRWKCKSI